MSVPLRVGRAFARSGRGFRANRRSPADHASCLSHCRRTPVLQLSLIHIYDSAHLLKLANELKKEVDKTDKDTLSIAVIRKADEIERLAHIVKEKMKVTVGSN